LGHPSLATSAMTAVTMKLVTNNKLPLPEGEGSPSSPIGIENYNIMRIIL